MTEIIGISIVCPVIYFCVMAVTYMMMISVTNQNNLYRWQRVLVVFWPIGIFYLLWLLIKWVVKE